MPVPPTTMIVLTRDPISTGAYNPHAGTTVRGSVIPTLGGVVIQDFGPQIMDQRITISDEVAITKDVIDDLITAFEVASEEYYFTDGYECYKVQFARPNGLLYKRNLATSFFNVARYDYQLNLVVKDTENV
jgi:hypothetical protein